MGKKCWEIERLRMRECDEKVEGDEGNWKEVE